MQPHYSVIRLCSAPWSPGPAAAAALWHFRKNTVFRVSPFNKTVSRSPGDAAISGICISIPIGRLGLSTISTYGNLIIRETVSNSRRDVRVLIGLIGLVGYLLQAIRVRARTRNARNGAASVFLDSRQFF